MSNKSNEVSSSLLLSDTLKTKSPTLHITIWFMISVFIISVVLACVFQVEVVARGQGKIVPISRVQIVQPEFNGKIVSIQAHNGSEVKLGDVLIELDTTDAEVERNTILAEMNRLRVERSRISSFVSSIDSIDIPARSFSKLTLEKFSVSINTTPEFFSEQTRLLEAEVVDLQASVSQISARIAENDQSIAVTKANIKRIEAKIAIQEERLTAIKTLLNSGSVSRSAFLDVQETLIASVNEREIYLNELNQKRSQETVFQAERHSVITARRNQLLQRKSEIGAQLETLKENLRTAERLIAASQLKAPRSA